MPVRKLKWALAVSCPLIVGCGGGGSPQTTSQASPLPRAPGSVVVWAVGDGANGSEQAKAVAGRIASDRPDRLLYLGDVYESGTAGDFARHYKPVYGRLAKLTEPTPGNHDWPQHVRGYDPYWSGVRAGRQRSYYSFRLGGWRLIGLNSEAPHGGGSAQYRWLRRELRKGRGTCRIAFWHRPRYSAGTVHGDQPDVAPLWDAVRGRVRIVLNGHEHDMQRLRAIGGTTELVSGAGGAELYRLRAPDRRLAFGNDTAYGALRLELSRGQARFAFVRQDGRVLDSGKLRCRT